MKIISWNVNGFRSVIRKDAIQRLLEDQNPDVLLLQEIKCSENDLQKEINRYSPTMLDGYFIFVLESAIPGRHGVAVIMKEEFYYEDVEDETRRVSIMPYEAIDPPIGLGSRESRLQAFHFNGILVINTYTVNVRQDLSRVEVRAKYDNHIHDLIQMWKDNGNDKVLVMGDFNVVSDATDYHGPRLNPAYAGMTDSERLSFENFLQGHNMVDTFRHFHPEESKYSYWSYRGYARSSNRGWRLDYALATRELLEHVTSSDILTDVTGSDHAPIVIELSEEVL